MTRALELIEPLPSQNEDCFAQFDRVFDSLADELHWQEARPSARAELPTAPAPAGDELQQYESAFAMLDDKLAESDRVELTIPATPPVQIQAARASVSVIKPRRARRTAVTFDDVFDVLENLTVVRRRNRLSEERHLVARLLADTRQLCADLDLQSARVRVEFAVLTLENHHFDRLPNELDELARHIRYDLRFCSLAPGKKAASR
jgi:hypothetical protein